MRYQCNALDCATMPKKTGTWLPQDAVPRIAQVTLSSEIVAFVERAAASDETILLQGETGTGKTLLARIIHNEGPRAKGPFLNVNCAALPDTLLERELFGHAAGAFTDAREGQPGLLEAASAGTLLLDEVGDLSPAAQAKLLSAVESGVIRRLGTTHERPVDVRIIAATNRDLSLAISRGEFRRDLLHRLAVLRLTLQPLRKRRGDIRPLAELLLRRAARGGPIPSLSPEALEALEAYSWPGNVRELDHALRQALTLDGAAVRREHLPAELDAVPHTRRGRSRNFLRLDAAAQRAAIRKALDETGQNRTMAAQRLGIARSTLWAKMARYELSERRAPALLDSAPREAGNQRLRLSGAASGAPQSSTRDWRNMVDRISLDIVHAWRILLRQPGATLSTVFVLALGIGLATAMFALGDPFLFKPLPYAEPDRLVLINLRSGEPGPFQGTSSQRLPRVADWQGRSDLFVAVAAYRRADPIRFRFHDGAVVVRTAQATEQFFEVLGTPVPAWNLMRQETAGDVVNLVLTAPAFSRLAAADPILIGGAFARPEGGTARIGAGLPSTFVFPSRDVIFPIEAISPIRGADLSVGEGGVIIARLAPGASAGAVRSALEATLPEGTRIALDMQPLDRYMTSRVRSVAAGALAAGLLVLLLCAANVANLVLARGFYRGRELATRLWLGASRLDLARLALVELTLLLLAGTAAGLMMAQGALVLAGQAMPAEYVALGTPRLTLRSALFSGLAAILVAIVGMVPAWGVSRALSLTRAGEPVGSDARPLRALRFALAASQTALTLVLLIGATLMIRSYANLMGQDPGFSGDVLVLTTSYVSGPGERFQADVDTTIDRLRRLPGAQAAGAAVGSMLDRLIFPGQLFADGHSVRTAMKRVTPDYFEAVGSALIHGRALTAHDDPRRAMVITQSAARQLWPGKDPVGRRVGAGGAWEVVGVVADEINFRLDMEPQPTLFVRMENPWGDCAGAVCGQVSYVLRLDQDSPDVRQVARRAIVAVNPDAVVFETATIRERLAGTVKDRSFAALVLGLFSVAAVGICAAGVTGLVAFVVTRRTREIAIRVALGALPSHVIRTVSSEVLAATATGAAAGFVAGRWASSGLEHLVYGIQPGDWTTAFAAVLIIFVVVIAAVAVSAVRALRLSPAEAMRVD
jgi:putative ABC transport system permease protein